MKFPSIEVSEITKTIIPKRGDSYAEWRDGSLNDLQKLVNIGACDPGDAQNDSPSIAEFLENLKPFENNVKLIGYVIYPPRDDARVAVEGFEVDGLTSDQALELFKKYGNADERNKTEVGKSYRVRFWWD